MIDFHTHIYPDSLAPRAITATTLCWPFETDAGLEGQLRLMDRYGLRKCAALCFGNRPEEQEKVNQFAIAINSDRVFAFGSVHPHAPDAVEQIDRLYEAGIRGVKFQPIRQHFSLEEEACRPVFKHIGELGMLTVFHCGVDMRGDGFDVLPASVQRCIDFFDGAPVICAHMGGMFVNPAELERLYPLPVYVDTALSARHLGQYQFDRIAERFGPARILFGTDMPWASMRREMMYIEHAPFSDEEKERIFDTNAERLMASVKCKNAWI